jgi:hypothetical protein
VNLGQLTGTWTGPLISDSGTTRILQYVGAQPNAPLRMLTLPPGRDRPQSCLVRNVPVRTEASTGVVTSNRAGSIVLTWLVGSQVG